MAFTLDTVVPWGRSMEEYVTMFELSENDLDSRILGCADGPASFNAEMKDLGRRVISIDPVYAFSAEQIREQIDRTYPTILQELRTNSGDYVWDRFSSPEHLGQLRMESMNRFLADFPRGHEDGRYVPGELPDLPFGNEAFDLALCSHFLFLYSEQLSAEFHFRAIAEMLRVAKEVRIFPLVALGGGPSPYLEALCGYLYECDRTAEVRTVDYEFQRGAHQMLSIW